MDRHELDRRDTEVEQVRDRRLAREAGVRAAQVLPDAGMAHREAPHVGLVDDRLLERPAGLAIIAPVEALVDDHAAGHRGGRVLVVDLEVGVLVLGIGDVGQGVRCAQSTPPSIALA